MFTMTSPILATAAMLMSPTAFRVGAPYAGASTRPGRNVASMAADATDAADGPLPSFLANLGLSGQRAAVSFINDDKGFNCAKQLLALSQAADAFAEKSCAVVVVRPPQGALPASVTNFPTIKFFADEDNALRRAVGVPDNSRSRGTYVVLANGTVCGSVSSAVDAQAHSQYALRLLRDHEAALELEAAAQRPSMDALKKLVVESAAPSAEQVRVEQVLEKAKKDSMLRAQSMRAEATRNVKFSWGQKTMEGEGARLAAVAEAALEAARADEATWVSARAKAEASGDAAAAENAKAKATAASAAVSRAREDECGAAGFEIARDKTAPRGATQGTAPQGATGRGTPTPCLARALAAGTHF